MKSLKYLVVLYISSTANFVFAENYTQLEAAKDAPQQLHEIKPLIGDWHCKRQVLQVDGSWQIPEQVSRWNWRYTLNGHAVQDFWYPKAEDLAATGMGTNVRVYDPKSDTWKMSWTSDKLARFQAFDAVFDGKTIVMNGDYSKSAQRPAHLAKITFHNISAEHFDWKYESSKIGDGKKWQEGFRLNCDKL